MIKKQRIIPKLGRVQYINTKPIYYGIEKGIVKVNCEIIDGTPAELNNLLRTDQIDISVISSLEYAKNFKKYLLLPNLSIGSDGSVESVLFFSKVPFQKLEGKNVLLTKSSLTSRNLIKILLNETFGINPNYRKGQIIPENYLYDGNLGALVIGDEALRIKEKGLFPYVLDLGLAWKQMTNYPFAFALWAVRREFYSANRKLVEDIHQGLLKSKEYSATQIEEISAEVHQKVNLSLECCRSYFQNLKFDLDDRYLKGLALFFNHLRKEGQLTEEVKFEFIDGKDIK